MLKFLLAVIVIGTIAGVISGMVKIGWEAILPPRTQERDETNPPQRLLQQMGIPRKWTHAYFYYATDQKVHYVALIMHFSFSIAFGVLLVLLDQYFPIVTFGQGSVYGIVIWIIFHIIILPAMKTIPSALKQPFSEHFSEFLGHIVWAWSMYLIMVALVVITNWLPNY
ncbi:DUF1440 domain-containing protein [Leuconostoc sp. JNUCC 76]